jgi:hypothetical protein
VVCVKNSQFLLPATESTPTTVPHGLALEFLPLFPHVLLPMAIGLGSVILSKRLLVPQPLESPSQSKPSWGGHFYRRSPISLIDEGAPHSWEFMDIGRSRNLQKLSLVCMCVHIYTFLGRGSLDFPCFLKKSLIPKGSESCSGSEPPSS